MHANDSTDLAWLIERITTTVDHFDAILKSETEHEQNVHYRLGYAQSALRALRGYADQLVQERCAAQ